MNKKEKLCWESPRGQSGDLIVKCLLCSRGIIKFSQATIAIIKGKRGGYMEEFGDEEVEVEEHEEK